MDREILKEDMQTEQEERQRIAKALPAPPEED